MEVPPGALIRVMTDPAKHEPVPLRCFPSSRRDLKYSRPSVFDLPSQYVVVINYSELAKYPLTIQARDMLVRTAHCGCSNRDSISREDTPGIFSSHAQGRRRRNWCRKYQFSECRPINRAFCRCARYCRSDLMFTSGIVACHRPRHLELCN